MEILVRQDFTPSQIRRAEAARDEFRPNRYTSGSANLDDMIQLGKAVILCSDHTRKFSPKAARYQAHPAKNMRQVIGNCDVCRVLGLSFLFLNEKDATEERKKLAKFQRSLEYGAIVTS